MAERIHIPQDALAYCMLPANEWNYIISGQGRLTVFVAPESSQTYDFRAGDVGYMPNTSAHYLENTGDEDLVYVGELIDLRGFPRLCDFAGEIPVTEVLQAPIYNDISVAQWLGLTPKQVFKNHLGFSGETLERLPQGKPYVLLRSPGFVQDQLHRDEALGFGLGESKVADVGSTASD